jgi:hypothetical protein
MEVEFAVVYVISPQKEFMTQDSRDILGAEFKPFLDEQKNSKINTSGGHGFLRLQVALVKDVEGFGTRQKLGRILAFDAPKRTLLLEYGAPPSPREEWKGAAFLDRQVTARSVRWGLFPPPGFPPEQVVYVRLRGGWSDENANATRAKLEALLDGPAEKRHIVAMQREQGDWATAMAPVNDLAKLVTRIDFAEVLLFDAENRALVLGPLQKGKTEPPKQP